MRLIKYSLAMFLLTAGVMLAVFLLWWTFTVLVVGASSPDKMRSFAWQFWAFAVPALACVVGGAALLQSSRAAPPRRQFEWFTAKNILIVAHPKGCELLDFMESGPGVVGIAREILNGVYAGHGDRKIYMAAMQHAATNDPALDGKVYAAIEQAREIYPS